MTGYDEALHQFLGCVPRSMGWLEREWTIGAGKPAARLIVGAKISLIEAGASWAAGLNRGAASSLRVYVENTIAWLYYKDHEVEYNSVRNGIADLFLPKAVQSYLKSNDLGFEKAYAILSKYSKRDKEYYYSSISDFVHAHPAFTASASDIFDAAVSSPRQDAFLGIANMADEFISDSYLAHYRGSWSDVPKAVSENTTTRLGQKLSDLLSIH